MPGTIDIHFQPEAALQGGDAVLFTDAELRLGEVTAARIGPEATALVQRAAAAERFTGRDRTALVIPAPAGLDLNRLVVVGLGPARERGAHDWLQLGGFVAGKLVGRTATLLLDPPGAEPDAGAVAELALGMRLRAYAFDRYKTKRKDDDPERDAATRLTLVVPDAEAAEQAYAPRRSLAEGVCLARDLVNEPGNVLGPEELAARAEAALAGSGVEVEVFDQAELERRGFRALLAAGQGSARESRVVVMRWRGGGDASPVAFVGKGVCFDSGGISIKPAAGMEDMKGDMAGAACVIGLMQALAARKAKANVVGAIGLIENMPGGRAQRPGDIVTTLSGQTVEIVNTDAEGRLVLADVLAHVAAEDKPRLMVDLATLTGAIIVTLGHEYAGLLSNNDELAERLLGAGQATGERLWRLPMGPEFDKMIDSKFADMKNSGGRLGGSITAAQFLARFVGDTPWAHLDIAGLGFNSPQSEINRSWGSGFGVRLLDHLVREHYEG